jgi:hypothetical protein
MTGPDHYRSAEGLVVQAEKLMNGDELAGAAVWAAVAQVHATLALAAATARTDLGGSQPTANAEPGRDA